MFALTPEAMQREQLLGCVITFDDDTTASRSIADEDTGVTAKAIGGLRTALAGGRVDVGRRARARRAETDGGEPGRARRRTRRARPAAPRAAVRALPRDRVERSSASLELFARELGRAGVGPDAHRPRRHRGRRASTIPTVGFHLMGTTRMADDPKRRRGRRRPARARRRQPLRRVELGVPDRRLLEPDADDRGVDAAPRRPLGGEARDEPVRSIAGRFSSLGAGRARRRPCSPRAAERVVATSKVDLGALPDDLRRPRPTVERDREARGEGPAGRQPPTRCRRRARRPTDPRPGSSTAERARAARAPAGAVADDFAKDRIVERRRLAAPPDRSPRRRAGVPVAASMPPTVRDSRGLRPKRGRPGG